MSNAKRAKHWHSKILKPGCFFLAYSVFLCFMKLTLVQQGPGPDRVAELGVTNLPSDLRSDASYAETMGFARLLTCKPAFTYL
jgi:hypothetical protein